jgi:U4/U6 small nuclear ribonucleoprotein PRP31
LKDISKLCQSDKYQDLLKRVNEALDKAKEEGGAVATRAWVGSAEDDPAYKLVLKCNEVALDIENEMSNLHNFCRDKYKTKFPELETLVHHPVDYARIVKKIGNETDLTAVDLEGVLPSATIMVVSVTASTTSGRPLPEAELKTCLEACDLMLKLDEDKNMFLKFVEDRMEVTAPNLSIVLGSECASRLMGVAGGLVNLSKIPSCNIQVLGSKKKHLAGMSTSGTNSQHQGFIATCPLSLSAPPFLRNKACRLLSGKCALLARIDAYGEDPEGSAGQKMRQQIEQKIEKWQEPPPARIIKPLAIPDTGPKKRRGGRRLRKAKERYGMTELRKAQNRVNFNKAEEEIMDGEGSVGLGLIGAGGAGGMGKLRLQVSNKKQKLSKAMQKKMQGQRSFAGASTSGLASSLAFTPVQGIELHNPLSKRAHNDDTGRSGTESYFSTHGGFSQVRKT